MGQVTHQLEQEIRAQRSALDRNLEALETHTKALVDWRVHYRNHTGAALALAIGGGLLVGLIAGGRRPSLQEPHVTRPRHAGLTALRALGDTPRARHQVGETWDRILEALIGVASTKAIELIGAVLPGFRDEYEHRHAPGRTGPDSMRA